MKITDLEEVIQQAKALGATDVDYSDAEPLTFYTDAEPKTEISQVLHLNSDGTVFVL